MEDPKYVQLLKNLTYHNLDEGGIQVDLANVVDNGEHAISEIQGHRMSKFQLNMTRSHNERDHCFLDESTSPCIVFSGKFYRKQPTKESCNIQS
jgi:hypothetical protein